MLLSWEENWTLTRLKETEARKVLTGTLKSFVGFLKLYEALKLREGLMRGTTAESRNTSVHTQNYSRREC